MEDTSFHDEYFLKTSVDELCSECSGTERFCTAPNWACTCTLLRRTKSLILHVMKEGLFESNCRDWLWIKRVQLRHSMERKSRQARLASVQVSKSLTVGISVFDMIPKQRWPCISSISTVKLHRSGRNPVSLIYQHQRK